MSKKEVKNFGFPVEEVEETIIPELEIEETIVPEPVVEEDPIDIQDEPETAYGVVAGCSKLNVRRNPKSNADVVAVIELGDCVTIEDDRDNSEFYKVCTESGIEGFCMKKYINAI